MAVYMSATRQRRRMILIALATLVIGVVVGVVIGRSTAPGVEDAISDARTRGQNIASALRALPVEYEQGLTGAAGENADRIDDAIRRVSERGSQAIADTPWLTAAQEKTVNDAVAKVTSAARQRVSADEFQKVIDDAASVVEQTFGVT